ncbi:OB-fold nucleic acid binding domain-containing protein [Arthroderma uncinatum]|uniref:OB-fold nucleic acid binding domain-containing protein n=1 Tax=Arthroderma uncinatum TaxID=74035 RepID=UPI00144A63AD|nr:OB-fold nucleic acid binding domain-containing protein [Arthroderma uncinatum]KAF3480533.1 OB-fold nucleic acid binding domain-containing protein [Arthroderma uncinatum]
MTLVAQNKHNIQFASDDNLTFYPAYCYKASPTHFTWVKLSAADVHRLRRRMGYEGQNIHFYKNHPIQFICLAGVIVAREEQLRRTVLTLDDSSGSTIEVVSSKITPVDQPQAEPEPVEAAEETKTVMAAIGAMSASPIYVTSTTHEPLDITSLVPGVIVKLKGTVITFRSMRQLHLERFVLLPDMAGEMQFWEERTRFLVDVLNTPWYLTPTQVEQLRVEGAGEEEKKMRKTRVREKDRVKMEARRKEMEERDRERIVRRYEREEEIRRKYAERCKEVSGRLKKVRKR